LDLKKRFSEEQIIIFLGEAEAGLLVKELEAKNTRLKQLLAESLLEIEVTREALRKKVNALTRQDVVRFIVSRDLSGHRALLVIRKSTSALRYQPAPDHNKR